MICMNLSRSSSCSYYTRNAQSFSDYPSYAFGGWTSPAMKQFNDHGAPSCSVNVDIDWYPD